MKVMFDINVVLDIVAHRQPFYEDSSAAYFKVLGLSDFEDALVVAAAQSSGCSCIVTRNIRDFSRCGMRVTDPAGFGIRLD